MFTKLLFIWPFFFQSLQQDVETQKTMVRHLEKRVQQVELDAQEKVCKKSDHIICNAVTVVSSRKDFVNFVFFYFFVCLFVVSCSWRKRSTFISLITQYWSPFSFHGLILFVTVYFNHAAEAQDGGYSSNTQTKLISIPKLISICFYGRLPGCDFSTKKK